ncbi:hypothetical protein [Deinococcus soli (ex Cha et al. 2016)]|uniref:hypothetical protein n=1 Tax=Deinococcus soli (ex Cha et al. 2016) TaxID=1309411 RepID=UPI00166B4666|nr:hypothetical protein [Deinococcus soli (ex Cha et al. 2016)]GGB69010.1 hypothetical protein GCM10008019_26540 [Deinococcus soli (ex Cha et al. 2016)]
MTLTVPKFKAPKVAAETCACCGRTITAGHDIPLIGIVGPKCVHNFTALAQLIDLLDGFASDRAPTQAQRALLNRARVQLSEIGIEITATNGVLRVTRLTRKAADVAKSAKKRREAFVQDLQVAQGLFGQDAQRDHLAGAA